MANLKKAGLICGFLGRYDLAEGGGAAPWIAVRQSDLAVCGLDVALEDQQVFVYNASIEQFVATFLLLDAFLKAKRAVPPDVVDRVERIDQETFPTSEWALLLDVPSLER